jgi:nitrite reductase/ring-hydroxylating ferredoxin subunit
MNPCHGYHESGAKKAAIREKSTQSANYHPSSVFSSILIIPVSHEAPPLPATQANPLQRDPNRLELIKVAQYERQVQASLERVWENVLDWEHLPHLHDTSFDFCELDEAGPWGWRTWSSPDHADHIELCVDESCYVARSYSKGRQFSEIWTSLTDNGNETAILVEFYAAGVEPGSENVVGDVYLQLYRRLWDEDEAMMQERQRRMNTPKSDVREIDLGIEEQLLQELPLSVVMDSGEYRIVSMAGELRALPAICPHRLGPLSTADESGTTLRCPWHGYRFDLQTGQCLEPADARCRLRPGPIIHREAGRVILRSQAAQP